MENLIREAASYRAWAYFNPLFWVAIAIVILWIVIATLWQWSSIPDWYWVLNGSMERAEDRVLELVIAVADKKPWYRWVCPPKVLVNNYAKKKALLIIESRKDENRN